MRVPVYGLRFSPDQNLLRFSGSVWSENIFKKRTGPNYLERRSDQILKLRFGLWFRPNSVQPYSQILVRDNPFERSSIIGPVNYIFLKIL